MARSPILLLTRPVEQAQRFASEVGEHLEHSFETVFSPVIRIAPRNCAAISARYQAAIVTSENGARYAPAPLGVPVYCVGRRTAEQAVMSGGTVAYVAENADALVAYLSKANPRQPILHLRGAHAKGDIAKKLILAGIETSELVVYDQTSQELSARAQSLIEGDLPIILPLFSPRSARLTGQRLDHLGSNVNVVALSKSVADAWGKETGGACTVCTRPNGQEMKECVVALIRANPVD